MKKIVAIIAVILLLAPAAYALDLMEDGNLDEISGQAGLSITNFNGALTIAYSLGGLAWGDDNGYTGLGAPAAGHLTVDALGAVATLGISISQPSGNTITLDVDSSGIYMGLGTVNVTVTPPTYLKISIEAGNTEDFAAVAATTDTLGDLGFQALTITYTAPTVIKIDAH